MTGQLGICCAELMFNQMTYQTSYVRQNRTELKLNYDQMTSQRPDSHDPEPIQNMHLEILDMMHPQDKDCDPYEQE